MSLVRFHITRKQLLDVVDPIYNLMIPFVIH
jgi:hypothetical protein